MRAMVWWGVILVTLSACSKKDDATTEAPAPAEANAAATAEPATDETAAKAEAAGAKAEDADEVDPAATGELKTVDFEGKAPEGFAVDGTVQAVLGWTDKYGTNAVVIARQDTKGGALLVANHSLQQGDGSWAETRTFKERVADCEFDVTLAAKTGAWSVTDLDKNGLGEATFAYSAGCRSDVSPVDHKVIMTENGKKYVLRGSTRIDAGGGDVFGGDFKADPEFANAPAGFQAHAEKVWAATVKE